MSTVHRLSKYDPADRDERGHYIGTEDTASDHGPVEAAYLETVAAFARECGITRLTIREPALAGFVTFGVEPPIDGHGLAGLFPDNLTGYHDGARTSLDVGLELVRAMLRDNGAWCRLEDESGFFVHVGYDQYVWVGSPRPCPRAVEFARRRGLFAEPVDRSPYNPELDGEPPARPAEAAFWTEVGDLAGRYGAVVLEEGFLHNAARWHRITLDDLAGVRARLAPRARLRIWPDLTTDITGALSGLSEAGLDEIVWQHPEGHLTSLIVDESHYPDLPAALAEARAVLIISCIEDESAPLAAAVLPDPDGVLRARWTP
ncbi:RNA-binding protein [Nocardia crassostreae]|uniref:RNA-binding protein n=1 Tax=Nocardia crassostreae TaxID=53428 RepID=UPI00082F78A4|nr:RNA-binding protein [Nocardia crassostreae]